MGPGTALGQTLNHVYKRAHKGPVIEQDQETTFSHRPRNSFAMYGAGSLKPGSPRQLTTPNTTSYQAGREKSDS